MSRPPRRFRLDPCRLEGRLLLTRGVAPAPARVTAAPSTTPTISAGALPSPGPAAPTPGVAPAVQFVTPAAPWGASPLQEVDFTGLVSPLPVQVVAQDAGEATLVLARASTVGSLRVEVATDPSSPIVGVNVGAVDRTVTFADGQGTAALTVPIVAGAPNPGVVGVRLAARPLDPSSDGSPPPSGGDLDLDVVASDPASPPRVVSLLETTRGILVSFNRPMDPAGAADVRNYALTQVHSTGHTDLFWGTHAAVTADPIRLRAAQYDPSAQSVLLVPRRPLRMGFMTSLTEVHGAQGAARTGPRSVAGPGLVDLQGVPIDATTNPGKVELRLKPPLLGSGL